MRAQPSPSRPAAGAAARKAPVPAAAKKPAAAKAAGGNATAVKSAAAKRPADRSAPAKAAAPAAARRRPASKDKVTGKGRAAEQERLAQVLDTLDQLYPDAHCELNFNSPFELLIAVILSAQCTDDRVNMITPELFRRYPDPQALADSDPADVERIIFSTGFYRNKAKNIRAAARKLVDKFGGQVPRTMAELLSLPGVARKTANVVLGTAYGIPSGVVVDTHISRLSQRLGMTRHSDPVKIESDLTTKWPQERWIMAAHRLIWHGRRVCNARKPSCHSCALAPLCPSLELV